MIKKVFLLLFISVVFSSCAFNPSRKEIGEALEQNKAIIILDGPFCYAYNDSVYITAHTQWHLKGLRKTITLYGSKSEPTIYIVEPGRYYLDNFYASWSDGSYEHKISFPHIRGTAGFVVHPGEVIYLGRLIFDCFNYKMLANAINIQQDEQVVIAFLQAEYPELLDKMQTRLIVLSNSIKDSKKSKLLQ